MIRCANCDWSQDGAFAVCPVCGGPPMEVARGEAEVQPQSVPVAQPMPTPPEAGAPFSEPLRQESPPVMPPPWQTPPVQNAYMGAPPWQTPPVQNPHVGAPPTGGPYTQPPPQNPYTQSPPQNPYAGAPPFGSGADQPWNQAQDPFAPPGYPMRDPEKITHDDKMFAVLSYFGLLFVIPLATRKNSRFARFHAGQGLNLFLLNMGLSVVISLLTQVGNAITQTLYAMGEASLLFSGMYSGFMSSVMWMSLILAGFTVIGVQNAMDGAYKEVPLIGKIRIIN